MPEPLHPAASPHLPWFIVAPGDTDVLMIVMSGILILSVFLAGLIYLRLHALPDHFAHKKVQLEVVCVLGLLAMFTHMNILWVAALLLALVDLPDFITPLSRVAGSAEKIADQGRARKPSARENGQLPPTPQLAPAQPRLSAISPSRNAVHERAPETLQ